MDLKIGSCGLQTLRASASSLRPTSRSPVLELKFKTFKVAEQQPPKQHCTGMKFSDPPSHENPSHTGLNIPSECTSLTSKFSVVTMTMMLILTITTTILLLATYYY